MFFLIPSMYFCYFTFILPFGKDSILRLNKLESRSPKDLVEIVPLVSGDEDNVLLLAYFVIISSWKKLKKLKCPLRKVLMMVEKETTFVNETVVSFSKLSVQ